MNTLATVMYRNPLEEWWWESGVGYWVILIVGGGIAGLLLFLVFGSMVCSLWEKLKNRK